MFHSCKFQCCMAALAVLLAAACQKPAGLGGLSGINGTVLINDTLSDSPLNGVARGARVDLFFGYLKAEPDLSVYTNEDGEYAILGLLSGTYRIRCSTYRPWSRDSLPFVAPAISVDIKSEDTETLAPPQTLQYSPGADLLINATDGNGDPLPNTPVYLFNNLNWANLAVVDSNRVTGYLSVDTTRSNGTIFKRGVVPGTYYGVVNMQINGLSLKGRNNDGVPIDASSQVNHLYIIAK